MAAGVFIRPNFANMNSVSDIMAKQSNGNAVIFPGSCAAEYAYRTKLHGRSAGCLPRARQ
jgi:hypothetical protein